MAIDLQLLHEPISQADADFMLHFMHEDINSCLLKSIFSNRQRALLKQIHLRQRIEKKLPTIYQNLNWILPEQLNLEQSSSEKTAKYKSRLMNGKILLDLTLGMGIDTFFMSSSFEEIIAVEYDAQLGMLTEHNLKSSYPTKHVCILKGQKAEDYVGELSQSVDLIFIDPARRGHGGAKVIQLNDCSPDIIGMLPALNQKTSFVLLKTSPILDIQQAIHQLQHVKECHVLEADKECKELLFLIDFNFEGESEIMAINLDNDTQLRSTISEETNLNIQYSLPLTYIYEPGPAFLKSGLYKTIAAQTNTLKLHPHSHLYTSEDLIPNFPGRGFEVLHILKPNLNELKAVLPEMKANLTLRNYPGQTTELAKKLKLKDGGDVYLFATTLLREEKVLLLCKKC